MTEKELEDIRALHNAYDKHEPIIVSRAAKDSREFAICRTCGQVLMHKYSWSTGNLSYIYKSFNVYDPEYDNHYRLGIRTELDIQGIPKHLSKTVAAQIMCLADDKDSLGVNGLIKENLTDSEMLSVALKEGGRYALAYATMKRIKTPELEAAVCKDPSAAFSYWKMGAASIRSKPSAELERAICKIPTNAVSFALALGPSNVSRDGAAKDSYTSCRYAIEVDNSGDTKTTHGTPLRKVAFRSSWGFSHWLSHFPVAPNDAERVACSRTMNGAYTYALHVDHGPHKDTMAAVVGSRMYGMAYAINVVGGEYKGSYLCCTTGPDAMMYVLTFGNTDEWLIGRSKSNHRSRKVCDEIMRQKTLLGTPDEVTRKAAMKSSVAALGYIFNHNLWNDAELIKRASRNRFYKYSLQDAIKNRKNIAETLKERKKNEVSKNAPI